MASGSYTVTLTFDAPEERDLVDRLWQAFTDHGPWLAQPTGITHVDGSARIEFASVSDDPGTGPTTVAHATPGAEVVAALEGFSHERSLLVPVVRAMLAATAMRQAAGLAPRTRLSVEVSPAGALPQDSLSTHRSESVHSHKPD